MKLLQESRATRDLKFAPQATALLCIHWQNDVVDEATPFGAMFAPQIKKRGTLQKMKAALEAARDAGVTVIYLNAVLEPLLSEEGVYDPVMIAASRTKSLRPGSHGAAVCDELKPEPTDLICEHKKVSGFFESNLKSLLDQRGIETVVIAGIATNIAVEHTLRDAIQHGYRTILIEDCCYSSAPEYHDASVLTMRVLAADIITVDDFIQGLGDGSPAEQPVDQLEAQPE
jgi:nicotinamidase-related amidase